MYTAWYSRGDSGMHHHQMGQLYHHGPPMIKTEAGINNDCMMTVDYAPPIKKAGPSSAFVWSGGGVSGSAQEQVSTQPAAAVPTGTSGGGGAQGLVHWMSVMAEHMGGGHHDPSHYALPPWNNGAVDHCTQQKDGLEYSAWSRPRGTMAIKQGYEAKMSTGDVSSGHQKPDDRLGPHQSMSQMLYGAGLGTGRSGSSSSSPVGGNTGGGLLVVPQPLGKAPGKLQPLHAHARKYHCKMCPQVCEKHFAEKDIRRTAEVYDEKTGKKVVVTLEKPRLFDSAIPCVFPNCPSYLSAPGHSRENVEQKRVRIENNNLEFVISESVKSQEIYEKNYMFKSFSEFLVCLSKCQVGKEWSIVHKGNVVIFVILSLSNVPDISISATFDHNLELKLYKDHCELRKMAGESYPKNICNIKDIVSILDDFQKGHNNETAVTFDNACHYSIELLKKSSKDQDDLVIRKVDFLCEQLLLLVTKKEKFRYSTNFVIYFSLLYSISPHAYRYVRSTAFLNLPHPKTIQKICSKFNCNPKDEQSKYNFLRYIKQKFNLLKQKDIIVSLMIDEIYVKPYFDYKGGDIVGMSCNDKEAASTAYVFMIQSLLSSYKDVVHILPIHKINGSDLYVHIKNVVTGLQLIGFNVVCVVSDNNAINKKAMSFLNSPPKFDIVYKHPSDNNKPLFFLFDTVHILKCIRNNWLNTKNQSFIYPSFDNLTQNSCQDVASFSIIKMIYEIEINNLVKYAHTLNLKSLNPSCLERQNVKLVLNIFNNHVQNSILEIGEKHKMSHYRSTANFINIILKWWNIVNVKTLYKDIRLLDPLMKPLSINEENYNFLNKVLIWLDHWDNFKSCDNRMTKQTHLAFTHSTYALIQLTNYCINELNFKFLLPGRIQTDSLEDRFGKYRGMAGSQYLISMRQVFEVESKLRIQSLLPLNINSSSLGQFNVTISDIGDSICNENGPDNCVNEHADFSISVTEEDIKVNENQLPVLTYIAGYCVQSLLKKYKCQNCSNYLIAKNDCVIVNKNCNYDLIKSLDRGGLLLPHSDIVNVVMFNYIVVNKLISPDLEQRFLKCNNQRLVVQKITSSIIVNDYDFFLADFFCNLSEHSNSNILYHILKSSTNIFLNNYIKRKNDSLKSSKKRKLCTLSS